MERYGPLICLSLGECVLKQKWEEKGDGDDVEQGTVLMMMEEIANVIKSIPNNKENSVSLVWSIPNLFVRRNVAQ
jgi:hypothetical protein